jgi:hypothetical protein
MFGNERMRFCADCKLNVYNLSGMTGDEAENLITNAEGRLCVRFYRRLDGTIITQNCPVGWAKVKARTKIYATAAFSLIMTFLSGLFFASMFTKRTPTPVMGAIPARPTPSPTVYVTTGVMGNVATMGKVDADYVRETVGMKVDPAKPSARR